MRRFDGALRVAVLCAVVVAAAPAMMQIKVRIDPSARVDRPDSPWPMVQPRARMPPNPISNPPAM